MQIEIPFELPELDREATKNIVEATFERYRMYKIIGFEEKEVNTTAVYSDMPRGTTTSDSTANTAISNVDGQRKMKEYCDRIERTVNRLPARERFLITERYMKDDHVFDYQVFNFSFDPSISEFTYYKLRWKAFYKLALALNIQILKVKES